MSLPEWQAASAVRVSFGPATTQEYIDEACKRVRVCGEALRKTCMVTGDIEPLPADGVIQLSFGSACTWIIADAKTKQCCVIDPLPELNERIAKYMRCQHYKVKAILSTNSHEDQTQHNAQLSHLLGEHLAVPSSSIATQSLQPSTGYFTDGSVQIDGEDIKILELGEQYIRQVSLANTTHLNHVYLVGKITGDTAANFAFCGDALDASAEKLGNSEQLQAYVTKQTLICAAHDPEKLLVSRLVPANPCCLEDVTIPPAQLTQFLAQHPNTTMIDVREPYEQQLSHFDVPAGATVVHVPLSRLANGVKQWLSEDKQETTLLFFCRTGGRSSQAVQCLRRLGYHDAWHVAGGLALWQH